MTIKEIELDAIYNNPFQKRHHYNDIPGLGRTIAVDGLQQLPKARFNADGVQLKFGHRRTQAFRWLRDNWEKENLPNRYEGYTVMPLDIEELTDEQMFRGATIENNQRANLSPIEQMEEMKAWAEFGYNSKQIAEMYPGMSDSTVRGLMYFDNLSPEAKEALHKGEITQGIARDILSLQRVSTAEVVKDVIERVKTGKGKWNHDATPKEIIEDEIEDLKNVVQLAWNSSGKKPTVKDGGWALDMKVFPNQYLPLLTGHVAVQALDCFNDKPAQKLVLEIAEYLDADTVTDADKEYHQANRNQIEKRMGELEEVNPEYSQRLQHLLNPPSCGACQSMTKFNDRYFCGIKECYERKAVAWQRHGLQVASKKLGIDIYSQEDGNFLVLQDTYQNKKHADLWEKGSKDLRLAFMADVDRKKYQSGYEECPRGCVVLVVGKALEKLLEEKEQVREEKRVNLDEFREKMMEKRINELLWEVTAYLKSVLDGISDDAVMSLYEAPRYGWDQHSCIPEELSGNEKLQVIAEQTRREIALYMLLRGEDGVDDDVDAHETLSDLVGDIQKRVKAWKVKIPAEFAKMAARYDAEIAEAVAAETARRKK